MKVLVACEESQEVCKAFRALGHEAWSCDIQECSGGHPEWHIHGDVHAVLITCPWIRSFEPDIPEEMFGVFKTQDGKEHELPARWDLLIAHPPCTYLSNAGARWLYPQKGKLDWDRYHKGLEAKAFFMELFNAKVERIAVENPIPSTVFRMPEATQEIQPYMFGHPYTKKTRLWLKNLPPLVPTNEVTPVGPYVPAGTSRKDRSKYGAAKRGEDAKNMAKTFPGIARAMAEQWGGQM